MKMIAKNIWINNKTLIKKVEVVEVRNRKALKELVYRRTRKEIVNFINDQESFYYDHSTFVIKGVMIEKDFFQTELTIN